jgi:hypothetical protein
MEGLSSKAALPSAQGPSRLPDIPAPIRRSTVSVVGYARGREGERHTLLCLTCYYYLLIELTDGRARSRTQLRNEERSPVAKKRGFPVKTQTKPKSERERDDARRPTGPLRARSGVSRGLTGVVYGVPVRYDRTTVYATRDRKDNNDTRHSQQMKHERSNELNSNMQHPLGTCLALGFRAATAHARRRPQLNESVVPDRGFSSAAARSSACTCACTAGPELLAA